MPPSGILIGGKRVGIKSGMTQKEKARGSEEALDLFHPVTAECFGAVFDRPT